MGINVRFEGEVTVLSNVGRLMNDPRHFDAGGVVRDLLAEGHRRFVIEMGGVRDVGPTLLGLLMTITRQVRREGGEVALANVGKAAEAFLESMRMEDFWDVFDHPSEAAASPGRSGHGLTGSVAGRGPRRSRGWIIGTSWRGVVRDRRRGRRARRGGGCPSP